MCFSDGSSWDWSWIWKRLINLPKQLCKNCLLVLWSWTVQTFVWRIYTLFYTNLYIQIWPKAWNILSLDCQETFFCCCYFRHWHFECVILNLFDLKVLTVLMICNDLLAEHVYQYSANNTMSEHSEGKNSLLTHLRAILVIASGGHPHKILLTY